MLHRLTDGSVSLAHGSACAVLRAEGAADQAKRKSRQLIGQSTLPGMAAHRGVQFADEPLTPEVSTPTVTHAAVVRLALKSPPAD